MLPAGTSGAITLAFGSNALYRAGLVGGWRCCRCSRCWRCCPRGAAPPADEPARPWRPGPVVAGTAILLVGGVVIAGVTGVVVVGAAMGVRYLLRDRARLSRRR